MLCRMQLRVTLTRAGVQIAADHLGGGGLLELARGVAALRAHAYSHRQATDEA